MSTRNNVAVSPSRHSSSSSRLSSCRPANGSSSQPLTPAPIEDGMRELSLEGKAEQGSGSGQGKVDEARASVRPGTMTFATNDASVSGGKSSHEVQEGALLAVAEATRSAGDPVTTPAAAAAAANRQSSRAPTTTGTASSMLARRASSSLTSPPAAAAMGASSTSTTSTRTSRLPVQDLRLRLAELGLETRGKREVLVR